MRFLPATFASSRLKLTQYILPLLLLIWAYCSFARPFANQFRRQQLYRLLISTAHILGSAAAPVPPPHPEGPPEPVSEELGYFHRRYGGVPYPGFMVKSAVDELRRNFELKAEEVVIATFPK